MDESTDPERRGGAASHARGKHQAGGTSQTGGKHQAGKTGQADQMHQADPKLTPSAKHAAPHEIKPPAAPSRSAVTRRNLLISGGVLAAAFAGLEGLRNAATTPVRLAVDPGQLGKAGMHGRKLPPIQFDIGNFTAPAITINGILVGFLPVFTLFATATLMSRPSKEDQRELADGLDEVEKRYPFSPSGVFAFVAYGLPYFEKFPSKLFDAKVPRLLSDKSRFALEEAVPSPTDVSPVNPGIKKLRFNVPVVIEQNDLLFTLRSDNVNNLWDVLAFLGGSNMLAGEKARSPHLRSGLSFTGTRVMFVQRGMPRAVADQNSLPFAPFVNPSSPMWMGFADQQVNASAPAADVTFAGADGIHLTTARPDDYFGLGSLQHLSHDILDMAQFFDLNARAAPGTDGTFLERVQYMFRADPPPSMGRAASQFLDGGGSAFIPNEFKGFGDAARSAAGIGTLPDPVTGKPQHRMGHLSTLQRSSRTADGRPIHVRNDGPGFDSMDVPDGSKQPKLQFMAFVPSADFFATMRRNQASLDLQKKFHVDPDDNGLERFITATRRQNFLIPPRRHRAFPFAELAGGHPNGAPAKAAKSSPAQSTPAKSSPAPSSSGGGSGSGGSGGGGNGGGGNGGGGGRGGGGGNGGGGNGGR
jgi:uncharacterized membrane protein YgcG